MNDARGGPDTRSITVGVLARSFGLARSTLLYYDRAGLLSPSRRSPKGYRLYDARARERLASICRYRAMGLTLLEIRGVLAASGGRAEEILVARLDRLNDELHRVREQQRVIVGLLQKRSLLRRARTMDKASWVRLLRASGMDDAAMARWHLEFEAQAPLSHQDFLESLGIPAAEIATIRGWSSSGGSPRNRKKGS